MLGISGEFIMVHAAYQSHLGQDYFFAPRAKLADGIIWLMIVKAGITRANLLQVNSQLETISLTSQFIRFTFLKIKRLFAY